MISFAYNQIASINNSILNCIFLVFEFSSRAMNKILLIVCWITYLQMVVGQYTEEELSPMFEPCSKELNMTMNIFLSHYENFIAKEDDYNFNQIIFCAYKNGNFLNAEDTLDDVKFQELLVNLVMKDINIHVDNPKESARISNDACKDVEGTDVGDHLVKRYNCIIKYLQGLQ